VQADFAASITSSQGPELQEILETDLLETRLFKALLLLKKEYELSQLQQDINKEVSTL
jgi:ATP-dependent Lon protease